MNDIKRVNVELTRQELNLIIIGMTSGNYPMTMQKPAFELVIKLRDKIRDT
jgi:hypothetical protein